MKLTPMEQKLTDGMAPGVLCLGGFLGTDRRPLGEIIDTDNSTLQARHATPQAIATRLRTVLARAVAGLGTPVRVREGLRAVYHEAMGRIPSPWPGEGTFRKGYVELDEPDTGRHVEFTPLSVALIARHGFFEGRGARFRLDPGLLCDMLHVGGEDVH